MPSNKILQLLVQIAFKRKVNLSTDDLQRAYDFLKIIVLEKLYHTTTFKRKRLINHRPILLLRSKSSTQAVPFIITTRAILAPINGVLRIFGAGCLTRLMSLHQNCFLHFLVKLSTTINTGRNNTK